MLTPTQARTHVHFYIRTRTRDSHTGETVISTCSLFKSWTAESEGTIKESVAEKRLYLQHTDDAAVALPLGEDRTRCP
ncbi:hypothetical protein JOB18_006145 [Solea senegalensis]|uniref:Uncharacterized protein n=1 Tax=Solea senegalensis TaxID=28829 RepID=A0AAV6Q0I6_SOLSE|nr:hypothetical protein JOB18_006145 [Solea senegalensis]